MLLYAITSRVLLAETEAERAEKLIALAADWAANGVNYIQIREGDLPPAELLRLASSVTRAAHAAGSCAQLLINASHEDATGIALDSSADGIHLPSGLGPELLALTIAGVRERWLQEKGPMREDRGAHPPISVSCHSIAEIQAARAAHATLALFAPVFEKVLPGETALAGQGLQSLAAACHAASQPTPEPPLPVLALGGVTLENAHQCIAAGAKGIAAIRLFLNPGSKPDQDWRRLSDTPPEFPPPSDPSPGVCY